LQCIAAPVILLLIAHEDAFMSNAAAIAVKKILIWATVIVTALSMGQYLARSRHILDDSR
jgi:hypothetical protein